MYYAVGTSQIRRVRLPRLVTEAGEVSYAELVGLCVTFAYPGESEENYTVSLTYFDKDEDTITIASNDELLDAIDQFKEAKVLRITTEVRPKSGIAARSTERGTSTNDFHGREGNYARRGRHVSPEEARMGAARCTRNAREGDHNVFGSVVGALANAVSHVQETFTYEEGETPSGSQTRSAGVPNAAPSQGNSNPQDSIPTSEDTNETPKPPAEEPIPFIHGRHTCDSCLVTPIVGKRYHAQNLPDYDLCQNCFSSYTGKDIIFKEEELDRDRAFQVRWNRRREKLQRFQNRKANLHRGGRGPRGRFGRHGPGPAGGRFRGQSPPDDANNNGNPPTLWAAEDVTIHGPPGHPHAPHAMPPHFAHHGPGMHHPPPPHFMHHGPHAHPGGMHPPPFHGPPHRHNSFPPDVFSHQFPNGGASYPPPPPPPAWSHIGPNAPSTEYDQALKEAIRRSLHDIAPEEAEILNEDKASASGVEENTEVEKPTAEECDVAMEDSKDVAMEDSKDSTAEKADDANEVETPDVDTKDMEDAMETASVDSEKLLAEDDKKPAAVECSATRASEISRDESYEQDAAGNGEVAEAVGAALDKVANMITEMLEEADSPSKNCKPPAVVPAGSVQEKSGGDIDSGALIVENVGSANPEESAVKEESEWEVVDGDNEARKADDDIARAAGMLGSALFNSDLRESTESDGENVSNLSDSFSVPSTVPTIGGTASQARWNPQLTKLRDMGFVDENKNIEILERLEAANMGVGADFDEISVTRVVDLILQEK